MQYQRLGDFTRPGPSQTWVLVDEHPDSINDGWLIPDAPSSSSWTDLPASYLVSDDLIVLAAKS